MIQYMHDVYIYEDCITVLLGAWVSHITVEVGTESDQCCNWTLSTDRPDAM